MAVQCNPIIQFRRAPATQQPTLLSSNSHPPKCPGKAGKSETVTVDGRQDVHNTRARKEGETVEKEARRLQQLSGALIG